MKKTRTIFTAIVALATIALVGCPTAVRPELNSGPVGPGGGGDDPVFDLQDWLDGKPSGVITDFSGSPLATAGSTVTVTAEGIEIEVSSTNKDWGGLDVQNDIVSFATGDVITITGKLVSGGGTNTQLVANKNNSNWEPLMPTGGVGTMNDNDPIDWTVTLTADDAAALTAAGANSAPSGFRIRGNNWDGGTILITQILIER